MLVDYYPWSAEPIRERQEPEYHAKQLYSLFRNPLTHDLGLDLERRQRTHRAVIKRLTTADNTRGRSETGIVELEGLQRPADLSPVLATDEHRVVLLVDAM